MSTESALSSSAVTYLGTSSGILSSTTSDEFRVAVVQELVVDGHVLLLGQDCIVRLEAILVEQSLVSLALDVFSAASVS